MPTGYTDSIRTGISFKDFILQCSRAFGALITMRDEPNDAPIPQEILPSDYSLKAMKKAQTDLKRFEKMTLNEAKVNCQKEYELKLKDNSERKAKNEKLKVDYLLMLEKVNNWTPPTKEHEGLKKFMIEQITESIKWDCDLDCKAPTKQDANEWLYQNKKSAMDSIEYHRKSYAEEVKRCADRTQWIQDLFKSL